jgi:ElaB/YqjD/DUF883 family membrane-anchored ribosome-binding protein
MAMKYEEYTTNGNSRTRSPAEIDSDLATIRLEMSDTLRHLEDKFSPRALLEQLFSRAQGATHGSSEFVGNLGATIRDNPVPVLLLASGVVSLLVSERGGRTQGHGPSSGEAHAKLESVKARAHEIGDRAGELRERAEEAGSVARERVRDVVEQARERGTRTLREEPLVIVGLGLAIGAILGASFPVSERERHIVGREGQDLMRRGEGVIGRAKQAVQEGVERAEQVATQGTNTPEQPATTAETPEPVMVEPIREID